MRQVNKKNAFKQTKDSIKVITKQKTDETPKITSLKDPALVKAASDSLAVPAGTHGYLKPT